MGGGNLQIFLLFASGPPLPKQYLTVVLCDKWQTLEMEKK